MVSLCGHEENQELNQEETRLQPLHSSPLPRDLTEKLFGFCTSQAIITSVNLGIFDVIHDSSYPTSANEISKQLQTNEEATVRLLDTLVSLGLLRKEARNNIDFYDNTSLSRTYLARKSPNSIKGIIPLIEKSYRLYGNLEFAVREGENQWRRTYDGPLARLLFLVVSVYHWLIDESWDMFSLIYWTKKGVIMFLEGLRSSCKPEAERLMSTFDLSKFDSMCDLGGGTGDMSYAASKLYPNMTITVFELPAVVECAPSFKPSIYECPSPHKIRFQSGDFFKDSLPRANLYVLTRILQSFDEDKIREILKKVFSSLWPGGGILICEKVLEDDKSGPLLGNLSSLSMLVAGNKGSRERSGKEYRELLESCGFYDVQIKRNVGTFMDAILARKSVARY